MEKSPKPIPAYYSEVFEIQYFVCPNCLEFIEGDMCYICGRIYDISNNVSEKSIKEEYAAQEEISAKI